MAANSKIEWTDATWNVIVGCSLESPGCTNCYAMPTARRHELMSAAQGRVSPYAGLTKLVNGKPVWTGDVRLVKSAVFLPLRMKEPQRIFVASMGDPFHPAVTDAELDIMFGVMAIAHWHEFQLLTKRSARMRAYLTDPDRVILVLKAAAEIASMIGLTDVALCYRDSKGGVLEPVWPLPNVLIGVSVEDQRRADDRRLDLAATWAGGWRTFVSYEPALGPVDWTGWDFLAGAISGGESGPRARPSHPDWHRATRDFCAPRGIPYLFKQWGRFRPARTVDEAGGTQPWLVRRDGGNAMSRCYHLPHQVEAYLDPSIYNYCAMAPLGKARAGRLLDGIEHNGMPGTSTPAFATTGARP